MFLVNYKSSVHSSFFLVMAIVNLSEYSEERRPYRN